MDVTCISCAKVLQLAKFDDQIDLKSPVYDGVYLEFHSYGNYGSRLLDYSSYGIQGYLCDECFLQKSDRLYVWKRGDENNKEDRVGIRLSEYEDFKNSRFVALGEKYGPAYLAQYVNGEHWIDGVRSYREVTSNQRSEAEKILMGREPVVAVPRDLLEGLLGALRAAEYNAMDLKSSIWKTQYENETLKKQLAGAPREIETLAILHKEASELSVTELQEMKEDVRWARKIQKWMVENPLFHEDGTALDTTHLWEELTKGSEGLRKFVEQEKIVRKKA